MRVLVCGSRDYDRKIMIESWLEGMYAIYGDDLYIIEGGAKGADAIADEWARSKWKSDFKNHWQCAAEWYKDGVYDRTAGFKRNAYMLSEGKPDLVIGFKDGFNHKLDKGGTEHMLKIASEAGIPAFIVEKI